MHRMEGGIVKSTNRSFDPPEGGKARGEEGRREAPTSIPTPVTHTLVIHTPLLQIKSGSKRIFGREFVDEGGASSNWLFVAPTARSPSGKAIVKVWGLGDRASEKETAEAGGGGPAAVH